VAAGGAPEVAEAAGGTPAPAKQAAAAGCWPDARAHARRRTSRSAPVGGALTTLGRRRRSVAASRSFCSSGNC
jgi:hypothetical protein